MSDGMSKGWASLLRVLLLLMSLLAPQAMTSDAWAQGADDQSRATAREMGAKAVADFKAGDYDAALDGFTRAHALVGLTTTGYWRARSLEKLGRLVEASEQLLEVRRMTLGPSASAKHRAAQVDAGKLRAELMQRIARLTLTVAGGLPQDAAVSLDGKPMASALVGAEQLIDPGEHTVIVKRGEQQTKRAIKLAEGEKKAVTLELPPAAGGPVEPQVGVGPQPGGGPKPLPTLQPGGSVGAGSVGGGAETGDGSGGGALGTVGWIFVGVGGAGLIAGAVTGGLALDRKSTLDENCINGACPPQFHGDVDAFDTLRTTSTIGFIAGGVLAATGITLVIVDAASGTEEPAEQSAPPAIAVNLGVTPTGLMLQGTF